MLLESTKYFYSICRLRDVLFDVNQPFERKYVSIIKP